MADVEVLPLPDWGGAQIIPDNLIRDYARANVAHFTAAKDADVEALRAEVERLTALTGGVEVQRDANWQAYSDEKARAERLAEALRGIRRDALDGCSAMDCARDAFDVLNELGLLREQEEGRD